MSKFVSPEDWISHIESGLDMEYAFPTFGLDNKNYITDYLNQISDSTGHTAKIIVLDVPNGYIVSFASLISDLKVLIPDITIFAGNVVTPEGV